LRGTRGSPANHYIIVILWIGNMLKVNNIEVVYSNVILTLRGVSLNVPDGKLVTVVGANGAGKSTTLKAISGLLKTELGEVTHGNIEYDDVPIHKKSPQEIAGMGIIQIQEGRRLFSHLSAEENLRLGAYLRDNSTLRRQLEMVYRHFPRLKALRNNISGYLSGGEQQMLVIGRGLMSQPKIMLIDEASLGLSPIMAQSLFEAIVNINREEKIGMLVVEQNVLAALKIAEYGYVMENGRVVLDGPTEKLRENPDIKEFYLGLGKKDAQKSYREVKHYKRRKRWL
jgi:branched-chain amino acid transport system ATP-binding protein